MLQLGNLASVTVTLPSGNRGTGMLLDFVNIAFSKQSWGGGGGVLFEYGGAIRKNTVSIIKFERAVFRHERRTATKFCTHVRIETRQALT